MAEAGEAGSGMGSARGSDGDDEKRGLPAHPAIATSLSMADQAEQIEQRRRRARQVREAQGTQEVRRLRAQHEEATRVEEQQVRKARLRLDPEFREDQSDRMVTTPLIPVSIYLDDERSHEAVEAAIVALLASAGLEVAGRAEPVTGSWYRRLWAAVRETAKSSGAREAGMTAAHAAETRLVHTQDAWVTATLLQNVGPVVASLQYTQNAVVRAGALLIIKVEGIVSVTQLTASQQMMLNHRPELARSPHDILVALGRAPEDKRVEEPVTAASRSGNFPPESTALP